MLWIVELDAYLYSYDAAISPTGVIDRCFLSFPISLQKVYFLDIVIEILAFYWDCIANCIFFYFRYTILATTTVSMFIKYVFYVSDMLMEGQWERKAVYTFYLELVRDLLHLSLYIFFFLVIFL